MTDSVALEEGGPLLPTAKVLLQFPTAQNEEVLVKVGVSAVDMDGARKNVEPKYPDGILTEYGVQHVRHGMTICPK